MARYQQVVVLAVWLLAVMNQTIVCDDDRTFLNLDDAWLEMSQLLRSNNYPHEIHYVKTSDGYIIKCYRILKKTESRLLPLLIVHGLLESSIDFLLAGNGAALGYQAPSEGMDTWLCNSRGNFESRNHTGLDPDKDREFWRFSFHEMGVYDLPAVIDHVLNVTNRRKLNYVGHSQGTTQFLIYASTYPEESRAKVNHFYALAPVAFMSNAKAKVFEVLSNNLAEKKEAAEKLGLFEFLSRKKIVGKVKSTICSLTPVTSFMNICGDLSMLMGDNYNELDKDFLRLGNINNPAGSSLYQIIHFMQLVKSGKFRQYDRDLDCGGCNLKHYGQTTPPDYEIEKIRVPMTFYYGRHDLFTNYTDVIALSEKIRFVTVNEIPDPNWGHLNFILAKNVKTMVNDVLIADLKRKKKIGPSSITSGPKTP